MITRHFSQEEGTSVVLGREFTVRFAYYYYGNRRVFAV